MTLGGFVGTKMQSSLKTMRHSLKMSSAFLVFNYHLERNITKCEPAEGGMSRFRI